MMKSRACHHNIKASVSKREVFCPPEVKADVLKAGCLTALPGPLQHLMGQVTSHDFPGMRSKRRGENSGAAP